MRATLIAVLCLLASPMLGAAQTVETTLGNGGEIYTIRNGTVEELFPSAANLDPANEVLALDIAWPDGTNQRRVVPSSVSPEPEAMIALVYEKAAGVAVLLWQAQSATGGPTVKLASFDGADWSDVFVIDGVQPGLATAPTVVVTRDTYEIEISTEERYVTNRSILHLFWKEGNAAEINLLYTPLVLVEGHFLGWNPTLSLTTITADDSTPPPAALPAALASLLHAATSNDGKKVAITFANTVEGTIESLEIGILPLEMAYLSEEIRDAILAQAGAFGDADLVSVSAHARNIIINIGHRFSLHPAVIDYVANEVTEEIVATGPNYTTVEPFADAIRDYSIDLVSTLLTTTAGSGAILEIDVGGLLEPTASNGQPAQILDLRSVASHPAPAIGVGPAAIFTSPTGRDVLIAWDDADGTQVFYLETTSEGWSETRGLAITETRSRDDIHALFAQRVH